MTEFLNATGNWVADILPVIAPIIGILAFAWAFIFLTVRAAVKSALKVSSPLFKIRQDNQAERQAVKAAKSRKRAHPRYGPESIKPAPSPRDWAPADAD